MAGIRRCLAVFDQSSETIAPNAMLLVIARCVAQVRAANATSQESKPQRIWLLTFGKLIGVDEKEA
jgi:hypothetical protein